MLYTGVRIGEATALRWEDVDFRNKKVSVNKTAVYTGKLISNKSYSLQNPKTKTSRREVPLCDSVINLLLPLKENKSEVHLIFHNKNNDIISNKVLNKALKNLIVKLNAEEKKISDKDNEYVPFPVITSHSFRHTNATFFDKLFSVFLLLNYIVLHNL